MFNDRSVLSRRSLRRSSPGSLLRLARFLRLRTEGMSHRQVAELVRWRTTRPDMTGEHRFRR